MKLYTIIDNGIVRAWEGTQAAAKAAAKEYDGEWKEFEVGTAKDDLLEFLNKFVINMDEEGNHEEAAASEEEEEEEEGEEDEAEEEEIGPREREFLAGTGKSKSTSSTKAPSKAKG